MIRSVPAGAWPYPFADSRDGRLTRRQWLGLAAVFVGLHFVFLALGKLTGNYDPLPNHDHVRTMRQILGRSIPTTIWPPGFGAYLAAKWMLAHWLGLPFESGKWLVDVVPVAASGLLTVRLGQLLTRNRLLALAAGLSLAVAPLSALASAEGLAVVLFQPIFTLSMVLLVGGAARPEGFRLGRLAVAGAIMGLACLVRGNPQFLIFALLPWLALGGGAGDHRRRLGRAVAGLAVFFLAQSLVLVPWSLAQRTVGRSGVFSAPVVYYAFFDGMIRHDGFKVSEDLRTRGWPELDARAVVDFHLRWLRDDPVALAEIYAVKFVRAWYLSDSGRWDTAILASQAPLWLAALAGLAIWWRRRRSDPALWLVVLTVRYLWTVSAVVSGLARYLIPAYGLVGLAAGISIAAGFERWSGRQASSRRRTSSVRS